jgi:hypothetical protein
MPPVPGKSLGVPSISSLKGLLMRGCATSPETDIFTTVSLFVFTVLPPLIFASILL